MIGKAFKSLKGMINEAKEIVTEKVSSISSSNISNSITNNTFIINGRTYYENKLLGEGVMATFSKYPIPKGINML